MIEKLEIKRYKELKKEVEKLRWKLDWLNVGNSTRRKALKRNTIVGIVNSAAIIILVILYFIK